MNDQNQRSIKPEHPAPELPPGDPAPPTISWHDPLISPFRVSGFAWRTHDATWRYRRLPVISTGALPEAVDRLAWSTAGGQIAFQTDSPVVNIRANLSGPATMYHMPATGQCGFDLYVGEADGFRYCGTSTFELDQAKRYETEVYLGTERKPRSFRLNLPLYQGVDRIEIGLDEDASLEEPPAFTRPGRVVTYGTSITQGGCASRPGMAYTNILSRRLDIEIINLGFSGSGKGEVSVVSLVADVADAALFILDYEANTEAAGDLPETLPRSIDLIRERYPQTPILVVSRSAFSRDLDRTASRERRDRSAEMQRTLIDRRRDAGDSRLHFLDGRTILGDDFGEGTVDGVHLNDLGFLRMADALEPVLRRILDDDR